MGGRAPSCARWRAGLQQQYPEGPVDGGEAHCYRTAINGGWECMWSFGFPDSEISCITTGGFARRRQVPADTTAPKGTTRTRCQEARELGVREGRAPSRHSCWNDLPMVPARGGSLGRSIHASAVDACPISIFSIFGRGRRVLVMYLYGRSLTSCSASTRTRTRRVRKEAPGRALLHPVSTSSNSLFLAAP